LPATASPAGLLRGKRKHGLGAGRLVEQRKPIGDRILLRRSRELVHEAFVTKILCDGPTLRQKAVGMPGGSTRTYSICVLGSPYHRSIAPSVVSGSRPLLNHGGAHRAITDEPA